MPSRCWHRSRGLPDHGRCRCHSRLLAPLAARLTRNVAQAQDLDAEHRRTAARPERARPAPGHQLAGDGGCRQAARGARWLDERVGRVLSARWIVGGQVLTTGTDGTARLWDGTTGQLLQTYRGSSRFLADATLATDDLVVAGGADGLLRFRDRDSGYLLWTLPAHKSEIYGVHVEGGDIVTRGITGELVRWTLPSPGRVIQTCGDHERCAILLR